MHATILKINFSIVVAAYKLADAINTPKCHVVSHQWNTSYGSESPQAKLLPALYMISRISEHLDKKSK